MYEGVSIMDKVIIGLDGEEISVSVENTTIELTQEYDYFHEITSQLSMSQTKDLVSLLDEALLEAESNRLANEGK